MIDFFAVGDSMFGFGYRLLGNLIKSGLEAFMAVIFHDKVFGFTERLRRSSSRSLSLQLFP